VPRYEWKSTHPRVQKCIFCSERLAKGLQTACAEACPTGATKFGDREELLNEAAKRIKDGGGKYVTKIFGQEDVGGTSVFYISPVPFEQMGFDNRLGKTPMPVLTMTAMSKIPNVVTVGSVMLGGVWWITNRREEVARHEGSQKPGASHKNQDHR
jgi:formate dehydrogenase iron-sulfur subunit